MIGKDGGIAEGDAHLTNYRENANFFLDPMNPSNFEIVWNRASTIYKTLGAIDTQCKPAKTKAAAILAKMSEEYKKCATSRNRPSNRARFSRPRRPTRARFSQSR